MDITQNDDDTFIINSRENGGFWLWLPLFLGSVLLLVNIPRDTMPIAVVIGLGIFPIIFAGLLAVSPRRSQLVLSRSTNTAMLRRRFVLDYRKHHFELTNIQCLYQSQKRDIEAAMPDLQMAYLTLRVNAGMDEGSYAINTYLQPGKQLESIQLDANTWLEKHIHAGH